MDYVDGTAQCSLVAGSQQESSLRILNWPSLCPWYSSCATWALCILEALQPGTGSGIVQAFGLSQHKSLADLVGLLNRVTHPP